MREVQAEINPAFGQQQTETVQVDFTTQIGQCAIQDSLRKVAAEQMMPRSSSLVPRSSSLMPDTWPRETLVRTRRVEWKSQ